MKTLHVSAGGCGKRIASYITSLRECSLPKHLLPIPTESKTILGEIISKAHMHFEDIIVWPSKENRDYFDLVSGGVSLVKVQVDTAMTGPLGPMVRALLIDKNSRVFSCAGDFYCDFSWNNFERFHDSHDFPISVLVARSIPVSNGARFLLSDNNITEWERVIETCSEDRINIGCYIVDQTEDIINGLMTLKEHKEDLFFDFFVKKKLIAGYDPGVQGFNVNTEDVYKNLLQFLCYKS